MKSARFLLFLSIFVSTCLQAQFGVTTFSRNTIGFNSRYSLPKDSIQKPKVHSPKKAATMSALLPGLGQVYNKKYWKVPIIYAALGGLGYGFGWNQKQFKIYKDALHYRYDDDPATVDTFALYPDAALVTFKNYYQRYRDLCVIGMVAVYTLQVLDAAVDAHLFTFDVGPDLSFRWQPDFQADQYGSTVGFRIGLTTR